MIGLVAMVYLTYIYIYLAGDFYHMIVGEGAAWVNYRAIEIQSD